MFRNFLKSFIGFFLVIVLIAGCEGQDCIQADDFGEYDTDLLEVDSTNNSCFWGEGNNGYGDGSPQIAQCLENYSGVIRVLGTECSVNPNGTCHNLRECMNDSANCSQFSITGPADQCRDVDDSVKQQIISNAYSSCLEGCINQCTASNSNYETDWEENAYKSKGAYKGIQISQKNKIYVQTIGSVVLKGATTETIGVRPNSKNIVHPKSTPLVLKKGAPFTLTGKWCRNGSDNNCPPANQVGEFGNPGKDANSANLMQRFNFLRRGIIFLDLLPAGSSLSSEGTYTGPLIKPNFDAWFCNFNEKNGTKTEEYNCITDFSNIPDASSFKTENEALYSMQNDFVKVLGGSVIPEKVLDYIITNPFEKVTCQTVSTDLGYVRECSPKNIEGFIIKMPGAGSQNTSSELVLQNGFILNKSGKNIKMIYPTKLAFKISGKAANQSTSITGECTVTVSVTNNSDIKDKIVKVKADGHWHFLTESPDTQNKLLLNKNKYNTLERVSDDSNHQNFEDTKKYDVVLKFNENETWKDEDGREIPCGEGMFAFFLPQNEILIETSGFIYFKNLLSSPFLDCIDDIDTNSNKKCSTGYDISFDIINPMYGKKNMNQDVIKENFYEYISDSNYLKSDSKKVNFSKSNSADWKGDIFVRKGQLLRFDESNWFDITPVGSGTTNTYSIKNKVVRPNVNFTTNIANGLFIKIQERPALLCKGKATENVDNELCNVTYTSSGTKKCSLKYTDVCVNTQANPKLYCPFGCYPTGTSNGSPAYYFVEDGNANTTCQITEENKDQFKDVTKATCEACKKYIETEANIPSPELTVDIIQCYNLEEYSGSVRKLTNTEGTSVYDAENYKEFGLLTQNDVTLGAKKLKSVFENGDYGTFEGVKLDTTDNSNNAQFEYSGNELPFNSPRILSFLVLDNEDFTFDTSKSYNNNQGQYSISFTPQETFSNGAQLSVVLANKDWKVSDGFTSTGLSKFKSWIVKYDIDPDSSSFSQLSPSSLYQFDSNGLLVKSDTKEGSIDMVSLASNISGLKEEDYKDLRLFFKIIDKPETDGCKGDKLKVSDTVVKCRCKSNPSSTPVDCGIINCGNINSQEDFDNKIEEVTIDQCQDYYFNNSGKYTVQLKTPKDVINSTGYVVKYVMEPILKLLDGQTIGLAVNNAGKYMGCRLEDSEFRYGGNVTTDRIGTICSPTDPVLGEYCKKTTTTFKNCVGTPSTPVYCVLPNIDESTVGEICSPSSLNLTMQQAQEEPIYCILTRAVDKCVKYIDPAKLDIYNDEFGKSCKYTDQNCFQSCQSLDSNLYKSRCVFISDGRGFVQKFYQAVISDSAYQIILRLCFTLMIMFYGLYYLLGMAELSHGELIKRVIKISFIYLMVGKDGWIYYNMFFVKFFKGGVDYLVFAIAGSFDDSSSLNEAFLKNNFYDKSVLFSGVDKNLALMFSDQVSYKIWGLFFVSFFGWLYVFLIYSSIITYIMTVANALLIYLSAQFFISMLLSFGPIFFVLLVFDKTKEMFNKWINNLVSFSLEQIFLLTCLSLFNMLVYNIIKFVLSYRVCWRPIWVLDIPILGRIELMSFWKATTAVSPTSAASSVPGLFQILLIYLIADLMKNFIEFMTGLGADFGGGGLSATSLSSDIRGDIKKGFEAISKPIKEGLKKEGLKLAKKTIGYKTKEEEKAEEKSNKVIRNGLKSANKDADKAVENYKKENGKELLEMSPEERNKKLAEVRKASFASSAKGNKELMKELAGRNMDENDLAKAKGSDFASSNSLIGLGFNQLHGTGSGSSSDSKTKAIADGKTSVGKFSDKEIKQVNDRDRKEQIADLKDSRGSLLKRKMTNEQYKKSLQDINNKSDTKENELIYREGQRNTYDAEHKKAVKEAEKSLKTSNGKSELKDRIQSNQETFKNDNKFNPDKKPPMFAKNNTDLINKEFEGKTWKDLDKDEKKHIKDLNNTEREDWKNNKDAYDTIEDKSRNDLKNEKVKKTMNDLDKKGVYDPFKNKERSKKDFDGKNEKSQKDDKNKELRESENKFNKPLSNPEGKETPKNQAQPKGKDKAKAKDDQDKQQNDAENKAQLNKNNFDRNDAIPKDDEDEVGQNKGAVKPKEVANEELPDAKKAQQKPANGELVVEEPTLSDGRPVDQDDK